MQWFKVSLSVDQVANGDELRLQEEFDALFMAARGPRDMALFSTSFKTKEGVDVYFSPESVNYAKGLIEQYSGVPCDKPSQHVILLVGHADARERLLGSLKKRRPIAQCTACGRYSWNPMQINQRCSYKVNKKRCRGVFGSMLAPGDWEECPDCNATGEINREKCPTCGGKGWIAMRPK